MQRFKNIACLTLTFTAFFIFISCDVNDSDGSGDSYSYQFRHKAVIISDTTRRPAGPDSSIVIQTFSVEPGIDNVFIYKHRRTATEGVADGGLSETLVFQVPADSQRFEYRGDKLTKATALYRRSCFCPFAGEAFKATSGFIRGEKLSSVHWIIHAEVNIDVHDANIPITFEEPFYVK